MDIQRRMARTRTADIEQTGSKALAFDAHSFSLQGKDIEHLSNVLPGLVLCVFVLSSPFLGVPRR